MVFITKLIYRRNLPPLKEMLLWNNNLCVTTSNSGVYIYSLSLEPILVSRLISITQPCLCDQRQYYSYTRSNLIGDLRYYLFYTLFTPISILGFLYLLHTSQKGGFGPHIKTRLVWSYLMGPSSIWGSGWCEFFLNYPITGLGWCGIFLNYPIPGPGWYVFLKMNTRRTLVTIDKPFWRQFC